MGTWGSTLADSAMKGIICAMIMGQGVASTDADVDVPAVLRQRGDQT